MPIGPDGQKRPADVIGNAIKVAHIATGQTKDIVIIDGKNPHAKALGKIGGKKRAANLSPERRREIAASGAAARWGKP